MPPHHNIGEVEDSYLAREIALCTKRRQCYQLPQCAKAQMRLLHNVIEGKPLLESRRDPGQHGWVDSGTMLLSGSSFIRTNKLISGGMPTNGQL